MPNTTITVSNTTLFHVAASVLGDATQWNRIAALNGLVDPMLAGVVTLRLPVGAATNMQARSVGA